MFHLGYEPRPDKTRIEWLVTPACVRLYDIKLKKKLFSRSFQVPFASCNTFEARDDVYPHGAEYDLIVAKCNLYFSSSAWLRLRESAITDVQVLVHIQLTALSYRGEIICKYIALCQDLVCEVVAAKSSEKLWFLSGKAWESFVILYIITKDTRLFRPQKICVTTPTGSCRWHQTRQAPHMPISKAIAAFSRKIFSGFSDRERRPY